MKISTFSLSFYVLSLLLMSSDLLTLLLSLEVSSYFRVNFFVHLLPSFEPTEMKKYFWIILITFFMFLVEKIYIVRYDFWSDTKRVLKGLFFSFLAVFTVLTLTKISDDYSRAFILMFFIVSAFLVPISKRILKHFLFRMEWFKINVKILANNQRYETLYQEIEKNWYFGFTHNDEKYDMVLISSKDFSLDELQAIIKEYTQRTKDIYVVPYLDYLDLSSANVIDYANIRLSAIHIENRLLNYKNIMIKYMSEKIVIIAIFPFALLLHTIISFLIKMDSSGPIIFKQNRLGKESKVFKCYKYRTMYVDNEILLAQYLKQNPSEIEHYEKYHKYHNDPRITRIGRFLRRTSLDELPQFYNILKGNMNLIGPRPYMLCEEQKIGTLKKEIILKTNPGITGLWQVSGRSELTFQKRVELDVWYIQNWSLWIDFVIFIKTLKVVFSKVGAK